MEEDMNRLFNLREEKTDLLQRMASMERRVKAIEAGQVDLIKQLHPNPPTECCPRSRLKQHTNVRHGARIAIDKAVHELALGGYKEKGEIITIMNSTSTDP